MNNNTLYATLAVIVVLAIGGYLVWGANNAATPGTVATTTDQTAVTDTTTGQPTPTPAAGQAAPAVTTGTLVVASISSAIVSGKVAPNGDQTVYWYQYGRAASLGSETNAQSIGSGQISITAPAYITGLATNTTYSYRLVAKNSFGTVYGTTYTFTTNTVAQPVGNSPSTHTNSATSVSRTSAVLNGLVSPNSSPTSYWYEYGTTANFGNTTAMQSAGNGIGSVAGAVTVSNLVPLTKYFFRLNAQNAYGTVTGAVITFTTSGPTAVVVPQSPLADTTAASGIGNTTATMNGTVNPSGAATTYWFEYGTDSTLGHILGTTTHTAVANAGQSPVQVSKNVTVLARGTKYYYRLRASNSIGSASGDTVTFTTR